VFTWLNKQGVRSDQGFEFQFTGRFDAIYREGTKAVSLYVEDGRTAGGLPCIIVDPTAFDRWDGGEQISTEQQTRLFNNLREAVEFQGLQLIVERGQPPAGARVVEL
jgi:hypothetical protein